MPEGQSDRSTSRRAVVAFATSAQMRLNHNVRAVHVAHSPPVWIAARASPRAPPATTLLALAALAVSSLLAVLVLTASDGIEQPVGRAALHMLVVLVPVATGLYAVQNPRTARFGRLLILAGFAWSLTVLAESESSLLYSTGRVLAWLVVPMLAFLMLSFPGGRVTSQRDRRLFGWVTAALILAAAASAVLVEQYPADSPWTTCEADCPPNAFAVVATEPAFVGDLLAPVREALAVLLLAGVTVALGDRARSASALRRVTAVPVFVVSAVATLLLTAFVLVRGIAPGAGALDPMGQAWLLCLPAIAAAFTVGLVRRRMLIGRMLGAMSGALNASHETRPIVAAARSIMGEPAVQVVIHDNGTRVDQSELVPAGFGVHELVGDQGPIAAVLIDERLDDGDELTDAVVSIVEAALREAQLTADLEASLGELDDSRMRIATAAEVERRRIERDLHDGAQQRLIALRMRLSLAEDLLREDPMAASAALHDLGEDVDHALDEIRALAHGIYPALLADRGLTDALRSFARRAPVPVQVKASGLTRHPAEIESAVYFTCLEALQNVAKHAHGATGARIELRQAGALEFDISDDGPGFEPSQIAIGAGFRNMRDRVEALGGTLAVLSAPGAGTVIHGTVPVRSATSRNGRARPVTPPVKHRSREPERDRKPEREQPVRKRRQKRIGG
jgi:signal transduction histidine kinase